MLMGDLNAQVAACTIGARRLSELAGSFGRAELLALFAELLNRSETMTRQALRGLPAARIAHVDYLDNDGIELDRLVRIEVAVTIADGADDVRLHRHLAAGARAVQLRAVRALCRGLLRRAGGHRSGRRIPNNGGCFRPIALHLPEGSLVNPREPAPTGCRTSTIKRITTCILGALRQAAPDRVPADSGSEIVIMHFGGRRSDGRRYVTSQLAGRRQRGVGAARRRRRDRDRCHQLHERAGRGAGAGGADPRASRRR